jgi:large subunit ribosomal protein L29
MKSSKPKALRELTQAEMATKLREARENLFKLRLRRETRQLEDAVSLRVARRDVARLMGLMHEKRKSKAAKGER